MPHRSFPLLKLCLVFFSAFPAVNAAPLKIAIIVKSYAAFARPYP